MENALDDLLIDDKPEMILASQGQRFIHYIVDNIAFYILVFVHENVLDVLGLFMDFEEPVIIYLYYLVLNVMFLALFEHFTGKTPGKFFTRTRVVKEDGSRPSFLNILGRNTGRLIPFDAFSYLFSKRGWHDQVSSTYVILENPK